MSDAVEGPGDVSDPGATESCLGGVVGISQTGGGRGLD